MDNLLNELRGSIRGPLQKGEWDAIQYFGERCAELAANKRIAALEAENTRLRQFARIRTCIAHHDLAAGMACEFSRVDCNEARAALKEAR